MSDQYIGEIRAVGFDFAPRGWALCDGQVLQISQNTALFSLLGTAYGGNGTSTFALPDLRGATPVHWGQGPGLTNYLRGDEGGAESVALTPPQMPRHRHAVRGTTAAGTHETPVAKVFAKANVSGRNRLAYGRYPTAPMSPRFVTNAGQGEPHNNMSPYLVVNYIIALEGIYPPRD